MGLGLAAGYARNDAYIPRAEPPDGLAGVRIVGVDRMEWRVIPDFSTAAAALQIGEVDFWDIVPADVFPALRANKALVVDTVQSQGSWGALSPNFLFSPFNDVRARQALALMVDQRDYMEATFGDEVRWRTCYAYLGCGLPYGTEVGSEPYRKQNLAKARQLLRSREVGRLAEVGRMGEQPVEPIGVSFYFPTTE